MSAEFRDRKSDENCSEATARMPIDRTPTRDQDLDQAQSRILCESSILHTAFISALTRLEGEVAATEFA